MTSRYTWEDNYVVDGRQVLLEATVEAGDPDVGQQGIALVDVKAFDEEGEPIALTEAQVEALGNDAVLLERIDDSWRDATADAMERRYHR